ncbi:glycosyltransferase family 2 protein [Rathayibacter oskolensis]|uniref:glycosyltransferase family 2 protein n=1 Tax=Rathayibacter oskolensis TaxID=1891671 RepID=UPI000A1CDCE2|nr:glycosyltransferase family 2 protein [Rathayibacter oskolensis]
MIYVAYHTPLAMIMDSIESVERAAEVAGADVEILVADNGGAAQHADALSGRAAVVGAGRNVGFGDAVNDCVQMSSGEWVLMMNPDSRARPELLESLLRHARPSTRTFFGSLLITNGRAQVHAFNLWWSSLELLARKASFSRRLDEWIETSIPVPVPRLCGAGLFGRRADLLEVGPFDASFFLYGEDVDFSLRARARGYDLILVPTAVIDHDAGTSSEGASELVQAARTDAHLRLLAHHRPLPFALVARLEYTISTAAGVLTNLLRGQVWRARAARFPEIRRWGVQREAPRFDPVEWASRSARKRTP